MCAVYVYKYYCLCWSVASESYCHCFSVRSASIQKHYYYSCLSMWFIPRYIALSISDSVHFRKSIISPSCLVCSLFSWNYGNHSKLCHFTATYAYLLPAKSEYTTPGYVAEFNSLLINQHTKILRPNLILLSAARSVTNTPASSVRPYCT
jgi:hypothetical protein